MTLSPDDPRHGTTSAYNHHACRCPACREANRLASARARERGMSPWVDPAPVLDWIALERARGVSLMSIARTSGVPRRTIYRWGEGHAAQDAIVDRFAVNVGRPSLYYACQSVQVGVPIASQN